MQRPRNACVCLPLVAGAQPFGGDTEHSTGPTRHTAGAVVGRPAKRSNLEESLQAVAAAAHNPAEPMAQAPCQLE